MAPEAGIRFETICETPAFFARADDPAVLLAGRLAEAEATTLVAFGTEAGLFLQALMSVAPEALTGRRAPR